LCPRFRHVVGELHAQKMVHVRAKCLLDAQGHFRRESGLAAEKVGERGAAHLQNLSRLRHVESESLDDFVLIRSPGWGGFFMGIGVKPWRLYGTSAFPLRRINSARLNAIAAARNKGQSRMEDGSDRPPVSKTCAGDGLNRPPV